MPKKSNWSQTVKPLLKKYKNKNTRWIINDVYQLVVRVILSAQDSDKHINRVAPKLFGAYPDKKALSKASAEDLHLYIGDVRNFASKASWLTEMAKTIKDNKNIPMTHESLIALKGIVRNSANVILREAGKPAEGVIVDLHVVRVAPRLSIAKGTDANKIEK
jgi:endonuclease-3